jgi:molybdate transport system substrate-binding protein
LLQRCLIVLLAGIICAGPVSSHADVVVVAVASNFVPTADVIAVDFTRHSGHEVRIVSGSSGRLYAQIVNGAPYDLFLSADSDRPARLESDGLASANSRFTYAIGQLVLWSRDPQFAGRNCLQQLRHGVAGKIAIANPALAPYGVAAREFLQHEKLWQQVQDQLVVGENIAQTLQFAVNGGARLALVAAAQLQGSKLPPASCSEPVPPGTHAPVEQQAVLLERSQGRTAPRLFLEFLQGAEARELIRRSGYLLPELPR